MGKRRKPAGAAWRQAFLAAVTAGGGTSVAAAAAGVHYQTPFNLKKRDPAFAARWAAAIAAGAAALARGAVPVLAADEVVGRSKTGPCIRKAGATRWSAGKEQQFLAELATSANVTRAARATGLSRTAIVARRQLEPGFAERWDAALEQGWACVDAAVVRAASVTLEGLPADDVADGVTVRLTAKQALDAWRDHRRAREGHARRRPGPRPTAPPIEQIRADILRRVRAIARAEEDGEPEGPAGEA